MADDELTGATVAAIEAQPAALDPALLRLEQAVLRLIADRQATAALPALRRLTAARPEVALGWWLLGTALHEAQAHEEALAAFERAVALAPDNPRAALGLAQVRLETGRPAAADFARLAGAAPTPGPLLAGLAAALAAENEPVRAEALLLRALAKTPGWREGQARLASLRQTSGRGDYDAGYHAACGLRPADLPLRLDWFQLLAKARRWDDAAAVLDAGERRLGPSPALAAARLFLLSEAGWSDDPGLFAAVAASTDPGLGLARIRHALRLGRAEEAAAAIEPFLRGPSAGLFWPYASLAWRLLGDARAEWLDRPDRLIASHDLGLSGDELAELAALLRTLHVMAAPYLGQSVRGGTQTDRPLLFRHEPIMRRTRAAIMAAVASHVEALHPIEPGHPLLGTPRDPLRLAGSWSVRLAAQGFHASHTHPAGWLSSACYIALPDPLGPMPAGALLLGTPPPELRLPLQPYRTIPPLAGRLVLFPATMWHATAPFTDGERLTIAFDVAVPRDTPKKRTN